MRALGLFPILLLSASCGAPTGPSDAGNRQNSSIVLETGASAERMHAPVYQPVIMGSESKIEIHRPEGWFLAESQNMRTMSQELGAKSDFDDAAFAIVENESTSMRCWIAVSLFSPEELEPIKHAGLFAIVSSRPMTIERIRSNADKLEKIDLREVTTNLGSVRSTLHYEWTIPNPGKSTSEFGWHDMSNFDHMLIHCNRAESATTEQQVEILSELSASVSIVNRAS